MLSKEWTMRAAVVAIGVAGLAAPAPAAAADVEPVAPLLASADVKAGESLSRRCAACHTFDQGGANRVGPNLWGVVGRDKGSHEGYRYSPAMAEAEGSWTYEDLNAYLNDPRATVPGTKMIFPGLKKPEERANLIAWLRTLSDNPEPLP